MAEAYKNGKMVTATFYKKGEHIVADNGSEHVIEIVKRYKRDSQGIYIYEVVEVDDLYQTNPLGLK